MRTIAKKDSPTAVEKTLEILVAFAENRRELGTSEISALTGFHKATTSRILGSLLEYGLVVQNVETKNTIWAHWPTGWVRHRPANLSTPLSIYRNLTLISYGTG